ncbi:MAG TPA: biotin/lipoyl-containing protein [Longimicrobiales bacterium]|nr:biotin/lipoyl-containing protein [Longimicrobiales bacterium]
MRYEVTIGERVFEVELGADGAFVDGRAVEASLEHAHGSPVRGLVVGRRTFRMLATRDRRGRWRVHLARGVVEAEVLDERTRAIRQMAGAGAAPAGPRPIVAPMPGMVVRVEVSEGDQVAEGQGIVIVEAMKMENELRSGAAGVVTRVHVREGDAVEKDQVLVDLAPPEGSGS